MARSGKRRSTTNHVRSTTGENATANDAAAVTDNVRASTDSQPSSSRAAADDGLSERSDANAAASRLPAALALRVVIEKVEPQVDEGRFAAKRVVGDVVEGITEQRTGVRCAATHPSAKFRCRR